MDILGLKGLHHFLLDKGVASHLLYLPTFDATHQRMREGLRQFVEALQPRLICTSLMANDYPVAVEVTRVLQELLPDALHVWGGVHASTAPEQCLEHADCVCVGEGEQALRDLIDAVEHDKPIDAIPNLCLREGGQVRCNPLYPLIEDLDSLPVVRQIPPNSFVQVWGPVVPVAAKHLARFKRYRGGVYKILTSRGCPHGCTYCINDFLRLCYGKWGVGRRSPEHVIEELEWALREGPPLEYVDFIDDCFLACSVAYLEKFAALYKARIGKPFIAKGTPREFTRAKMDIAVDAGMVWANMGLQSGSDRVSFDVYNRRIPARDFLEAARLIHEYPVAAYFDLIVDNPFESVEDTLETVETLMAVPKPYYILIFSLNFYPGTQLRERALEECPEAVGDAVTKDYLVRDTRPVNVLIEIAPFLHTPVMRWLVNRFRRKPHAWGTRLAVTVAKLYSQLVLSPITYFRLIKRTQRGSFWRTLKVLPIYFNGAFVYYVNNFSLFKRRA